MLRPVLVALALLLPLAGACRPRTEPASPAATAAGSVATASAPAPVVATSPTDPTVVADLPDFPGARLLATSSKGPDDGWRRVQKRELAAAASYPEVREFYRQAIAGGGWTVTRSEEKTNECKWRLAKGTSLGEIDLEWETRTAQVEIRLERKDR